MHTRPHCWPGAVRLPPLRANRLLVLVVLTWLLLLLTLIVQVAARPAHLLLRNVGLCTGSTRGQCGARIAWEDPRQQIQWPCGPTLRMLLQLAVVGLVVVVAPAAVGVAVGLLQLPGAMPCSV